MEYDLDDIKQVSYKGAINELVDEYKRLDTVLEDLYETIEAIVK